MANDLVTAETVLVSVPQDDPVLGTRLEWVMSGAFRSNGALRLWNMPTVEDRKAIVARRDYLMKTMKFDADKVGLLVTRMLQGFRARYTGEQVDPRRLANDVKLFIRELAIEPAVPTWAVALACNSIRLGQGGEGTKAGREPSTDVLRRMCDRKAWEVRATIGVLSQILSAQQATPEVSEAARKAMGRRFNKLHAEMVLRGDTDPILKLQMDAVERGIIPATALMRERGAPSGHSVDDLIAQAGGADAWNRIPDAKRDATAKALARQADKIADDAHEAMTASKA